MSPPHLKRASLNSKLIQRRVVRFLYKKRWHRVKIMVAFTEKAQSLARLFILLLGAPIFVVSMPILILSLLEVQIKNVPKDFFVTAQSSIFILTGYFLAGIAFESKSSILYQKAAFVYFLLFRVLYFMLITVDKAFTGQSMVLQPLPLILFSVYTCSCVSLLALDSPFFASNDARPLFEFFSGIFSSIVFFSIVITIGLFGSFLFKHSTFWIFFVAFGSICAAFLLSRTSLFEKYAVDLVYYSIGLVGVIAFFHSQYLERTEYQFYQDLYQLNSKIQNLKNIEENISIFTSDLDDQYSSEKRKLTNVVNQLQFLQILEENQIDYWIGLECARRLGIETELPNEEEADLLSSYLGPRSARLEGQNFGCMDEQQRIWFGWQDRISTDSFISELVKNPKMLDPVADRFISFGDSLILIEIVRYAILSKYGDDTAFSEYDSVYQNLKDAEEAYAMRLLGLQAHEEESKMQKGPIEFLNIYIWPYVVIALLSLKLSRPRN